MSDDLVLVTGATGFIATHVVKQLQEAGYRVRATVRNLKDEKKVKHLHDLVPSAKHKLELYEAELLNADCWAGAVKDCKYVMHVASPFPMTNPKTDSDVIDPAVNGTLNVLKAVAAAKTVKRVVLTSSTAAVAEQGGNKEPYTEAQWADPKGSKVNVYSKSKILAEKGAWDYVKGLPDDEKFELATVNPTLVVGPTLHGNPGTSTSLVKQLMEHEMPAVPRFIFPCVDVRDVALAHLRCMTVPEAAGNRHILFTKSLYFKEIAAILDKEFKSQGYKIPMKELPGFVVTFMSWFDSSVKDAKNFAGQELLIDNSRMKNVLGITPIEPEKTFVDMGYTMVDNGFVKKTPEYKGRPTSI